MVPPMRALAIVFLVGCASEPTSFETPKFFPGMCTGARGSAECPETVIALDAHGATGSLRFYATALAIGLQLEDGVFDAGPEGLHLERPAIQEWDLDGSRTTNHVQSDLVLDIPPNTSQAFPIYFQTTVVFNWSLEFDAFGPYRP
jgi:hypothetical protein